VRIKNKTVVTLLIILYENYFLTLDFVDDLLLTKYEANVFAGQNFWYRFEKLSVFLLVIPFSVCLRWFCFSISYCIEHKWFVLITNPCVYFTQTSEGTRTVTVASYVALHDHWIGGGAVSRTPLKLTEIITYEMCYVWMDAEISVWSFGLWDMLLVSEYWGTRLDRMAS
jgi:hypothetical protein